MTPIEATFSISIPGLDRFAETGWYYGVCALVFTISGLIVGFFIWRKGNLQTLDAEAEIRRTAEDLAKLREDLRVEEEGLRE